jgi:Protein of unknown function (DUF3429)
MALTDDPAKIPVTPLVYGVAGTIPFIAGALGILTRRLADPAILPLEALYSAVILSFLGGARWGFEILKPAPRPSLITLSMAPSVLGFLLAGLVIVEGRDDPVIGAAGLVVFAVLFVVQWLWDVTSKDAPFWYGKLRTRLTGIVVSSLLICAFGVFRL